MNKNLALKKRYYYCSSCGAIVERFSDRKRINSYCDKYNKSVYLQPILKKQIKKCHKCEGTGMISNKNITSHYGIVALMCKYCKGTGKIIKCINNISKRK